MGESPSWLEVVAITIGNTWRGGGGFVSRPGLQVV